MTDISKLLADEAEASEAMADVETPMVRNRVKEGTVSGLFTSDSGESLGGIAAARCAAERGTYGADASLDPGPAR